MLTPTLLFRCTRRSPKGASYPKLSERSRRHATTNEHSTTGSREPEVGEEPLHVITSLGKTGHKNLLHSRSHFYPT